MPTTDYVNDPSFSDPPVYPGVYRYDPTPDEGKSSFFRLDNVRCKGVEVFEGDRVPEAEFVYEFRGPLADDDDPQRVQDVFPLDAVGPKVVKTDDQLVVFAEYPDGSAPLIWHGYVSAPQLDLSHGVEAAQMLGHGSPVREFDQTVSGVVCRDGHDTKLGDDVFLPGFPVRFNPLGRPNCSPDGYDHGDTDHRPPVNDGTTGSFPVFTDPTLDVPPGGTQPQSKWTLSKAVKFLLFSRPLDPALKYPDGYTGITFLAPDTYDAVLDAWEPTPDPKGEIDPDDPTTYKANPIEVQDIDVTGYPWPTAVKKLIEPHGFACQFILMSKEDMTPAWVFQIYRRDTRTSQPILLQAVQGWDFVPALDPAKNNAATARLQRDHTQIVNAYIVDGALRRYEARFILWPLFRPDPSDAGLDRIANWDSNSDAFDPTKYREFGADECGEGHWDTTTSAWATDTPLPALWAKVFGDKVPFVNRRRPGEGKLITRDADGDRRKAELYVVTGYTGSRLIYDGTGVAQRVSSSDWDVMDDRLGVKLTMPSPRNWNIGAKQGGPGPFANGFLNVVECLATPLAAGQPTLTPFIFVLATVITGDTSLEAKAERRSVSPSRFTVRRRLDGRGWFNQDFIHTSSPYFTGPPETPIGNTDTDDTKDAVAHAEAQRRTSEFGTLAGSVGADHFTLAYQVGSFVSGIKGRNISFRQNLPGTVEAPVYPYITSVRWNFDEAQQTLLNITDRRVDPPPEQRRRTRADPSSL